MKLFSCFLFFVFLLGCKNTASDNNIKEDLFKDYVPISSDTRYFPLDSINLGPGNQKSGVDSFIKQWYSKILFTLKEPVLYTFDSEAESVRVLCLESFKKSWLIRVNKVSDTICANVKQFNLQSSENAPSLIFDTIVVLRKDEWETIKKSFNQNNFWDLAPQDSSTAKDGVTWLVEALLAKRYHVINRWSPASSPPPALLVYCKNIIDIFQKNNK